MSGAEDLARLTETIDSANELLLSPEIKMVDVGDGVMRPTNAMVMTNLATQLGGAMPYTSVEEGILGTLDGTNFSVLSSAEDEYVKLYRNEAGVPSFVDEYPNATATRKASDTAQAAFELSPARTLSTKYPWAVTDKNLSPILGVRDDGVAHAILDQLPGLSMLGDYAWAVVDSEKVVLIGVKWSGEVVIFKQPASTPQAYTDGPVGGQDVFVLVGGAPYQVSSSGDNFSPQVSAGQVSYIRRNGPVSLQVDDLPVAGSLAVFVNLVLHIVGNGQSLQMGYTSVVTTLQPPTANRLLTINDGVRLTNEDDTLLSSMVAPFKPLTAKALEMPAVQLSAQLNRNRALPSNSALLTSVHGRGGRGITSLWKGSTYYANSITAVTAAKAECDAKGYAYRVPFVDWIQGENDRTSAAGVYYGHLLQLQTDYDTDIRAISGQPEVVRVLLDQISNWTAYGDTESNVPLEQLQVALDYPDRFVCAGPKYWAQTSSDGIHLPAVNSMRLGAMHSRPAEAIINESSWFPTHCISATRDGLEVTLRFHTPHEPLVVDKKNVTDPGDLGLRWIDDAASAEISSIRLVGDNTLILTLSALPTGSNPQIGIADIGTTLAPGGPTSGPRACLRDSSTDLDAYGQPVFNWACHQRISVETV